MDNILICTDGSSKRNGKDDCVAGYGVWASDGTRLSGYETNSTSQRGELQGARTGLRFGLKKALQGYSVMFITDSAYIANCLKCKWYTKWMRLNWTKSTGEPVKNRDLWEDISDIVDQYPDDSLQIFQVKGHMYDKCLKSQEALDGTLKKFKNNNDGVTAPHYVFMTMLAGNSIADEIAVNAAAYGDGHTTAEQKLIRVLTSINNQ